MLWPMEAPPAPLSPAPVIKSPWDPPASAARNPTSQEAPASPVATRIAWIVLVLPATVVFRDTIHQAPHAWPARIPTADNATR